MKNSILLLLLFSISACSQYTTQVPNKIPQQIDTYQNINELVNIYPVTPKTIHLYKAKNVTPLLSKTADTNKKDYVYQVGVGDILNITVWDHPQLTTPAGTFRSPAETGFWVQSTGNIFYPLIGLIQVAGKNVEQIRELITNKLSSLIRSPQVDVNVASFLSQRVYVTGEVKNPGNIPITNIPLTLIDAINKSGGLNPEADWKNVTLTRQGKTDKLSVYALMQQGDMSQNALLYNDDIIHIPRNDKLKVFVMGEVVKPAALTIQRYGMSLTEALAEVGGINQISADATGIFVIRKSQTSEVRTFTSQKFADIYQFNLQHAASFILTNSFSIEPNDIVYVTATPLSIWNRVIQNLLPSISTLNLTSDILYNISR